MNLISSTLVALGLFAAVGYALYLLNAATTPRPGVDPSVPSHPAGPDDVDERPTEREPDWIDYGNDLGKFLLFKEGMERMQAEQRAAEAQRRDALRRRTP